MLAPRRLLVRLAAILALALILVGCSTASSASPVPSDATGYLYADTSELIFLHWDADHSSGGTAFWHRGKGAAVTSRFSVAWSEGAFALNFEPGAMAGWTGSRTGSELTLLVPAEDGTLRAVPLRSSTFGEYRSLAERLQ